jgi:hypothetical protein
MWNLEDLRFQWDWTGARLQNLRILVCQDCYDDPQPQLQARILSPDPVPVYNARPEPFYPTGVGYEQENFITTEVNLAQLITEDLMALIVPEGQVTFPETPPPPPPVVGTFPWFFIE